MQTQRHLQLREKYWQLLAPRYIEAIRAEILDNPTDIELKQLLSKLEPASATAEPLH